MTTTSESLRKAFGYLTKDELSSLKLLAEILPDNPVVVNIGAGAGTSGLAFMESRADLKLVTIDIEDGDSPLGSLMSEENALRQAGLWNPDRHWQICNKSDVTGRNWSLYEQRVADTVDLVFVDADHSYEGCKNDITAWLPNIKEGGIIALHDYKKHEVDNPDIHPKPWPGVDEAVDELLTGKYDKVLRVDSLVAFWVR